MELPADIDVWSEAAIKLTKEAGEIIKNAAGKKKGIEMKSCFSDLVTETDKQVEDLLINNLRRQFPEHCFIGEEATSMGMKCLLTDSPTWIIDPVDGTMNFVHGLPFVAVSIGLAYKKEVILGIVYIPAYDNLYTAIKGRGSFCNDKKLQVSGEKELDKALIISETGSSRTPEIMDHVFRNYKNLAPKVHGIRSLGSAATNMCFVASGGADSYYEYSIHCWDIAAGKLIVEEAGGVVIDPEGGALDLLSRRVLCASSLELARSLSNELTHIQLPRD